MVNKRALSTRKRLSLDALPLRLQHPVPEAAVLLGMGERSLWRAIRNGQLAAVRLGGRVYVMREELERYIREQSDNSGASVREVPPFIAARMAAAAARTART